VTLQGVYSYGSTQSLSELLGVRKVDNAFSATSQTGSVSTTDSTTDTVDISKPAQLYSKLQQLASSDPEKLKEVCSSIADELESASKSATGFDAKMYSALAGKFRSVSEGGDVSQLKPPEPPSGGPPPGVQGAYGSQQSDPLKDMQNAGSTSSTNPYQLLSNILDEVDKALSS
jgi:hypothetical protein